MIGTALLPSPRDIEKIVRLYNVNKLFGTKRDWLVKGFPVEKYIPRLRAGVPALSADGQRLDLYLLFRSMHQVNEACNKLWSTIEMYYHVRRDPIFCGKFSEEFLSSSTVPNLHYSNMSALMALLSLFGLCSWIQRSQKMRYFYIIRAEEGFFVVERTRWLANLLGNAGKGWHTQLIRAYEGLENRGIRLPNIDLKASKDLLVDRNRLHYDVLGQTSMKNIHGTESFFNHLPTVLRSISLAIGALHQVIQPIPNGCDKRFAQIVRKVPTLIELYPVQRQSRS